MKLIRKIKNWWRERKQQHFVDKFFTNFYPDHGIYHISDDSIDWSNLNVDKNGKIIK